MEESEANLSFLWEEGEGQTDDDDTHSPVRGFRARAGLRACLGGGSRGRTRAMAWRYNDVGATCALAGFEMSHAWRLILSTSSSVACNVSTTSWRYIALHGVT